MKRLLLGFAAACGLSLAAVTVAASGPAGPTGIWATPGYNGKVQVYACGTALCGRIVDGDPIRANPAQKDIYNKDPALRDRLVKGLVVFSGYTGGPPEWKGGPFYDPQKGDRSRTGTVTLVSDSEMVVKGCIGLFCRSERWRRVR